MFLWERSIGAYRCLLHGQKQVPVYSLLYLLTYFLLHLGLKAKFLHLGAIVHFYVLVKHIDSIVDAS